jgi:hypothetical protein
MFKSLIVLMAFISLTTYAQDPENIKESSSDKQSISYNTGFVDGYIDGFEDPITALSILDDYRCENGNKNRSMKALSLKNNDRYRNGSFYGASSAGNLVSVNVLNDEIYIELYLCEDVEKMKMGSSGALMSMVLDSSQNCIIDQVSALNMNIVSKDSSYNLMYAFFPIDYKGENPFCAQKSKIENEVYGQNSSLKANENIKSKKEIMNQIMVTKE